MKLPVRSTACASLFMVFLAKSAMATAIVTGVFYNHVQPVNPNFWLTQVTGDIYMNTETFFRVSVAPGGSPPPGPYVFAEHYSNLVEDAHFMVVPFTPPPGTTPLGHVFMTFDDAQLGPATVNITTFLGRKVGDYLGDVGPMTGFDPLHSPTFSGHSVTGNSGTPFTSDTLGVFGASQLAGMFPQFDLSSWSGGGQVTVLSTTIPVSELGITVPEPTVLGAFLVGGMTVGRRRR